MRLLCWNTNGIAATARAAALAHDKGGLAAFFASLHLDLVCLQETKLTPAKLTEELARPRASPTVPPWDSAWAFSQARQGYSGVATYAVPAWTPLAPPVPDGLPDVDPARFAVAARVPLVSGDSDAPDEPALWPSPPRGGGTGPGVGAGGGAPAALAAPDDEHRPRPAYAYEGRSLETDHGAFVLLNLYAPNAGDRERDGGARAALKTAFLTAVRGRVDALLAAGRQVIVVGDFNVAATPDDVATSIGWDGLWSVAEADALAHLTAPPMVDAWRATHPGVSSATAPRGERGFTVWDERTGARARDAGLRIDFCLVSEGLMAGADGGGGMTCEVGGLAWSDHDGLVLDLPGVGPPPPTGRPAPPGMQSVDPRWKPAGGSVKALFSKAAAQKRAAAGEEGGGEGGPQAKKAAGGPGPPPLPPLPLKAPSPAKGKGQPGIATFFAPKQT